MQDLPVRFRKRHCEFRAYFALENFSETRDSGTIFPRKQMTKQIKGFLQYYRLVNRDKLDGTPARSTRRRWEMSGRQNVILSCHLEHNEPIVNFLFAKNNISRRKACSFFLTRQLLRLLRKCVEIHKQHAALRQGFTTNFISNVNTDHLFGLISASVGNKEIYRGFVCVTQWLFTNFPVLVSRQFALAFFASLRCNRYEYYIFVKLCISGTTRFGSKLTGTYGPYVCT